MSKLITIEGIDGSGKSTAQAALEEVANAPVLTTEPNDSEGYDEQWNTTDWFGEKVRESIGTSETHPFSVLCFFLADHAHHYANTVQPALNAGHDVLCDRYIGSRYAYQSLSLDDMIIGDSLEYLSLLQEYEYEIDCNNSTVQKVLQSAERTIPESIYEETPLIGQYFFGLAQHTELYPEKLSHPSDDFVGVSLSKSDAEWSQLPDHTILIDVPVDVALNRITDEADEVFEKKAFLESVREQYLLVAERNQERFTVIDGSKSKEKVIKSVQDILLEES